MAVFLKTHFLFIVLMFSCLFPISGSKSLFHIQDVLPMLPVQVSWPIVNSLYSAVDLLPSFVGAVSIANNNTLQWKGACFYNNTASLQLHNKTESRFGGGTIHIKVGSCCFPFILMFQCINYKFWFYGGFVSCLCWLKLDFCFFGFRFSLV